MAVCVRVSLCPQQPDGGAATTAPVVAHAAEVFVRRFRYFQQLPPAVVRRVLFAAEPLVLGADRPDRPLRLCEQGTVADAMFMLLQGTAWAHSTPSTDALNGRLSDSAVEPIVGHSSSSAAAAAAAAAAACAVVKLKKLKRRGGGGGGKALLKGGNHPDSHRQLPALPALAAASDAGARVCIGCHRRRMPPTTLGGMHLLEAVAVSCGQVVGLLELTGGGTLEWTDRGTQGSRHPKAAAAAAEAAAAAASG